MTPRAIVCALAAGLLAAGCGSSDDAPDRTAPATATATPHFEDAAVRRMPEVPAGAETLPRPSSTKVHDPDLLRTAFESAQAMWQHEFSAAGLHYEPARVTFFHTTIDTPCGEQSREVGPFYCPASHGVYLNTDFFDALARTYRLSSGFAAGYIVAHEVGHHVQQLLGLHHQVALANEAQPAGTNARSVRVELQADCYAGVWLHTVSAAGELTEDDVSDITTAAAVVGDDFQRRKAGAELAPETWTHGSSAQRVQWVRTGLESGRPGACNTFA